MKPSSHKVSPKSRSYTVTKFLSKKVTLFESLSQERGSALWKSEWNNVLSRWRWVEDFFHEKGWRSRQKAWICWRCFLFSFVPLVKITIKLPFGILCLYFFTSIVAMQSSKLRRFCWSNPVADPTEIFPVQRAGTESLIDLRQRRLGVRLDVPGSWDQRLGSVGYNSNIPYPIVISICCNPFTNHWSYLPGTSKIYMSGSKSFNLYKPLNVAYVCWNLKHSSSRAYCKHYYSWFSQKIGPKPKRDWFSFNILVINDTWTNCLTHLRPLKSYWQNRPNKLMMLWNSHTPEV